MLSLRRIRNGARLRMIVSAVALLAPTGVEAQPIPPDQEDAIAEMLSVDVCVFLGASIDHEIVRARYECDGTAHEVRLVPPALSESPARTPRFAVEGAPPALEMALLAALRAQEQEVFPVEPHPPPPGKRSRLCTWLIALALLSMIAFVRPPLLIRRGFVVVLAAIAVVTLSVPDVGPVHDHLTFTARSDCARSPTCDDDRPGFFPPAYHLLEPIFRALPYRSATLSFVSLAFALLALLFQYATLRRLFLRRDPRGHVALLATLLTGLSPVILRFSVAHSWYPLTMALGWLATFLCALAVERQRVRDWVAAALALALAGTTAIGSVPMALVIGGASIVAARRPTRAWPLLPAFAFIAVHAAAFVAGGSGMGHRFDPTQWLGSAFFDPRAVPLVLPYLAIGGAVLLARQRLTLGAALGVALVSMLPTLDRIEIGFPFLSVFPLLHLAFALTAALLFEVARRRTAVAVLLLAALGVTTLGASEGLSLLHVPRPLSAELASLERSWDSLPPHRHLVVPPEHYPAFAGVDFGGDPVEARFPVGFYLAAMHARGMTENVVVPLDQWLDAGAPTEDTLVYLGTSLYTFLPNEIAAGGGGERPLLRRARDRVSFEPVHTFEVPTADHRFSAMRLGANRVPVVTVGFYRGRHVAPPPR